jgi:hypothetical protein
MSLQDFANDATKPFWASQTVWSSLAVVGASVAGAVLAVKSGDAAGVGAALTSLVGALSAIVGRYKARAALAPPFG